MEYLKYPGEMEIWPSADDEDVVSSEAPEQLLNGLYSEIVFLYAGSKVKNELLTSDTLMNELKQLFFNGLYWTLQNILT